jgi:hypothetical protein
MPLSECFHHKLLRTTHFRRINWDHEEGAARIGNTEDEVQEVEKWVPDLDLKPKSISPYADVLAALNLHAL